MNIASLLVRAAASRPDRAALMRGAAPVADYREFARRSAAIARWLADTAGLAPGDRVGFAMTNCVEFLEIMYGAWMAGLTAVPINAKLHPKEFAYILENSSSRLCFVTDDLAEGVAGVMDEIPDCERMLVAGDAEYRRILAGDGMAMVSRAPDDPAWLFYTSGTTGRPKGATLTNRNLMGCTLAYFADVDRPAEGDHWLHAAPMSHGGGCYGIPFVAATATQVVPESGKFDPPEIFDLLPSLPGAAMFAAPTMVKRLVEHPGRAAADASNWKTIVYGGGPMYVEDCKAAKRAFGDVLVQIYGQGECPMTITCLPREDIADESHPRFEARIASAGRAFANVEVMVADADDRPVPAGELGEVCVRGDLVMAGYWRNPEASADALRNGWLHTGDVGFLDEDGYLTLRDRSKDMIISGGTNIYPREVEEALLTHPGVAEVSVIGEPDEEWGENVLAYVVARAGSGIDAGALDAHCRELIARFKRPKSYRFVEALPKNNYGKVLKTDLRQMLAAEKAKAEA
ncbi:MAG: AMP-binding protein [Alphaproteobacteria bacterium]